MSRLDEKIEKLAERVHWAYCANYEIRKGKEYWTKGDFTKLDEETKEIDRETVRAVLSGIHAELSEKKILI